MSSFRVGSHFVYRMRWRLGTDASSYCVVELDANSVEIPETDFAGELCLGFGRKLRRYLAILSQRAFTHRGANMGLG